MSLHRLLSRAVHLLPLLLLLAASQPATAAPAPASCESPYAASLSLLAWLQPDAWDPVQAATCLDLPEARASEGPDLAVKLKRVLDARGHYVPVDDLSQDPNFVDSDGMSRVAPVAAFPELVLLKKDGRWLYSRSLLDRTPALYDATFSGTSGWVKTLVPPEARVRVFSLETWQYIYLVLLVLLSVGAGRIAQALVSGQMVRLARRFKVTLTESVITGTRRPLTWFATGVVFLWGLPDLQLGVRPTQGLLFVANTTLSLAVVLMAVRLVDVGADFFAKRAGETESKLDDQVIPLVSRALKVTLWMLGIVFVVQNMGVDVGSLLAGLGIGGLAFALAAKDTVENLFGSLTIFTDRPFQIGDWVIIGGTTEGVVEEVGFRSTRIRTFYNSVVSVPNAKVANSTVDNMGKRQYRRVKTTLGLRYDTPRASVEAYVNAITAYLNANPIVWTGTREVAFSAFGDSSLQVMVYFFLDVPDWSAELRERSACYLEFMRLAEEHGVGFAFPSTSVYIENPPAAA